MQAVVLQEKLINARPFLKWAGGKTQLLGDLEARLTETAKQKGYLFGGTDMERAATFILKSIQNANFKRWSFETVNN